MEILFLPFDIESLSSGNEQSRCLVDVFFCLFYALVDGKTLKSHWKFGMMQSKRPSEFLTLFSIVQLKQHIFTKLQKSACIRINQPKTDREREMENCAKNDREKTSIWTLNSERTELNNKRMPHNFAWHALAKRGSEYVNGCHFRLMHDLQFVEI